MRDKCFICNKDGKNGLCSFHEIYYKWDSSISGFRLKKRNNGSRYTEVEFHNNEIKLTKIIEDVYGQKNTVTSYHPIWAESRKKVLLEYDVYIKNKNVLIEYNGRQHYEYVSFFHKTKKQYKQQRSRDTRKKRLAKKQGVQLIVFKFDEPIFKDYVVNKIEGKICK